MKRRTAMAWATAPLWAGMARPVVAQVTNLSDAINQAGRQRMLSQRMAKAWLAQGQDVETLRAGKAMTASVALFERQLQALRDFAPSPAISATYSELALAWADYQQALTTLAPSAANTPKLIALDGQVLALAHRGTVALETYAAKPTARLVNLAGRQRMLSQRLAKYFLVRRWHAGVPDAAAQSEQAQREFTAALDVLQNAPEATAAIQQEIEIGRAQWVFLANALSHIGDGQLLPRHASDVFVSSENLLLVMDRVTGLYARIATG